VIKITDKILLISFLCDQNKIKKKMKKLLSIAFLSILTLGSIQIKAQMAETSPIQNVSAHEAKEILKNGDYVLLDIRTPGEFQASRIEGAINIDFYNRGFIDNLNKLDKEQAYFVYCRSGNRTGQSMRVFQALGFKNIVHLQRGIVDWTASGYSMVR
jgi:rhodanese-related sulfurtransferase